MKNWICITALLAGLGACTYTAIKPEPVQELHTQYNFLEDWDARAIITHNPTNAQIDITIGELMKTATNTDHKPNAPDIENMVFLRAHIFQTQKSLTHHTIIKRDHS